MRGCQSGVYWHLGGPVLRGAWTNRRRSGGAWRKPRWGVAQRRGCAPACAANATKKERRVGRDQGKECCQEVRREEGVSGSCDCRNRQSARRSKEGGAVTTVEARPASDRGRQQRTWGTQHAERFARLTRLVGRQG
eukprot:1157870-Pelagomonas_calceolata.AAC.5